MSERMPTELYVSANVRACNAQNISVYIRQKGDAQSGMILLKIMNNEFQCRLLGQMRDMDGIMKWFDRTEGQLISEYDADAQVITAIQRDPDLWVIEIETKTGENPFEGEEMIL